MTLTLEPDLISAKTNQHANIYP